MFIFFPGYELAKIECLKFLEEFKVPIENIDDK